MMDGIGGMMGNMTSVDWGSLVTSNGMSAPAWAFFTAIVVTLGGILKVAVESRRRVRDEIQPELDKVKKLSTPTGNGFAERVLNGQDELIRHVLRLEDAFNDHLTNHLRDEKGKSNDEIFTELRRQGDERGGSGGSGESDPQSH